MRWGEDQGEASRKQAGELPLPAAAHYLAGEQGLIMRQRTRILAAFILVTILMAIIGTVAQTQFVLAALADVGAKASLGDRLSMTGADLIGFAPLYGAIIAMGFAIAFAAAAFVARLGRLPRLAVFAVAGGVCIWLMLALMRQAFFGVPLIAGTRTVSGEMVQIATGVLAGAVFALLSRPRAASSR